MLYAIADYETTLQFRDLNVTSFGLVQISELWCNFTFPPILNIIFVMFYMTSAAITSD